MRFSDAKGRKVVSTSTAETVGKLEAFVVDPASQSVVALTVKKADGDTLPWAALTAFGADAITVPDADAIAVATPEVEVLSDKHHRVLGKRVLSTDGDELGSVHDLDVDPTTGRLMSLLLQGGQVDAVEGNRLIGVGSYAVVVAAERTSATRV